MSDDDKQEQPNATGGAERPSMFGTGLCVLLVGAIWLVAAFNMEISVPVAANAYGYRGDNIVNAGLVDRKQTHLGIAEVLIICGVLLAGLGVIEKTIKSQS